MAWQIFFFGTENSFGTFIHVSKKVSWWTWPLFLMLSRQIDRWSCFPREMEKEELYLLEKVFLLISYHIRTGLALTALCKSCSQTRSWLTKIYTQPFIPSLLLLFKHSFRCFLPAFNRIFFYLVDFKKYFELINWSEPKFQTFINLSKTKIYVNFKAWEKLSAVESLKFLSVFKSDQSMWQKVFVELNAILNKTKGWLDEMNILDISQMEHSDVDPFKWNSRLRVFWQRMRHKISSRKSENLDLHINSVL